MALVDVNNIVLRNPSDIKIRSAEEIPLRTLENINNPYLKRHYSQAENKRVEYEKQHVEYQKQYEKKKKYTFDYNDPKQVNSFADILLNAFMPNNPTKQKHKGNALYHLYDLTNIPEILDILKNTGELIRRGTIDPLLNGDFKTAGMNALVNIGETMDIPANIVKGAIFEGIEGVGKSINWDNEGRTNYDFDTGNFALDLGAEILIDPMNWITFGGWAIGKSALKGTTKELTEQVIKNTSKEVASELSEKGYKQIANKAIKAYVKGEYDTMTEAVNQIMKQFANNPKLYKYFDGAVTKEGATQIMKRMQDTVLELNSNSVLDAMRKLVIPQEAYESIMFKGALSGTGIYPAYKALQYTGNNIKDLIHLKQYKSWEVALKDMTKTDGTINIFKYDDVVKADSEYKNILDVLKNYQDLNDATNKGVLEVALNNSINHDLGIIDDLLIQNDKNILDFDKALREYLGLGKTERTALEEYISQLNYINKATDGAYDDAEKVLTDLKNEIDYKIKTINDETEFKFKRTQLDYIETTQEQVNKAMNVDELNAITKKTLKYYDDLTFEMKPVEFYKNVNEDIIINKISSDIAKHYEPIVAQLENILKLSDDYKYIKDVASDGLERINRYFDYIDKQLNTEFKRNLTKALYEGEELSSLKINFNKLKLTESFNANVDKTLEVLRSTMTKAPTFEGHSYTNLTKFIDHKSQAKALDKITKITDKFQKDLGSEIYIVKDEIKDIQKVQDYLKKTFKGDVENFLYTNSINGYVDGITEAIDEFLNVPLDNAELYFDTYNNLIRLLYQAKNQSADGSIIMEIIDELQKVSPYKVEDAKITVRQGAIIRQLKEEMTYANLSLMNIDSFNEQIVNGIVKNEGLGAFINTMARANLTENSPFIEAQKAARTLVNGTEHYRNYKRLLDRIVNINLHDDLKNRLISTLQKYANYNPMYIHNNFDRFVNTIIEQSENFEYGVKLKRSLSLDSMRESEEVMNILNRLIKDNPEVGKAHQALYDVYTLQAVMENEGLIEKYCNNPAKKYILFDIETLSTNANQGAIFEIGFKDINDKGAQLSLKLDPNNIEHEISEELLKLFDTTKDNFYKTRSGDILSEKAMLQNFIDMIKSYRGNAVLIGHNSDKFDVDYIIKRMRKVGISPYDINIFKSTTKLDTLSLLKAKDGYRVFQPDEIYRIKELLRNYTDAQIKAGIPKFIAPNNGAMASALNDMRKCLNDILNTKISDKILGIDYTAETLKSMSKAYGDIAGEIFNTMRNIKRTNKQLGHHFLMPELFDEMSSYNAVLNHELYKAFNEYKPVKNASQLLYNIISDTINIYGYKNVVDFDAISRWANIEEGTEINFSLGKSLTSLAKHLDKTKNSISNIEFLNGKQEQLREILNILLPKIKFSGKISDVLTQTIPMGRLGINDFYSNLKIDFSDTLSSFVMAEYLYNVYKNRDMLTPAILNLLGEDNIKFLENSSDAFNRSFNSLYNSNPLSIDSDIAKPQDIQRLIDDFNTNIINPLEKLGENDIYRARTHAMSMSLKPTQQMLEVYNDTMKSLNVEGQIKLLDGLKSYTNNLGIQQLTQTLKLSPSELYSHMAYNAPWIEFSMKDINSNPYLQKSLDVLISDPMYKELGFELIEDDFKRLYIVNKHLKSINYYFDKVNKNIIAFDNGVEIPKYTMKELDLNSANNYIKDYSDIANSLTATRNSINNLSENNSVGSLCEVLSVESLRELYSQLPDNVKKYLPELNVLTNKDLFTNIRYNHINIGTVESRKLKQKFTHSTQISAYKHHAEITALETKLKINYTNLYFGQEFGINNSEFFKNAANDTNIIQAFKNNPEYVLSALVKDKKFGYKAVVINANSSKALAEARRLNAVVLPRKVLSKVMETVNYDLMNSYRKHWWNKLLYTYKVGYLLSPATWFRNIIDSSLKTMVSTNEPIETLIANKEAIKDINLYNKIINNVINLDQYDLAKVKLYGLEEAVEQAIKKEKASEVLTALDLINKYDDIVEDIIRLSPQRVGYKKFTKENLEFYFNEMHPKLDRETFDLIDAFIKDGPSAGLTSAWTKYYGEDYDSIWHTFTNLADKALSPNNKVEQVQRLAEYLLLTKHGNNQNKAFYKVMKTHFDYADKAPWEIYTELIFPFYSFTMKNLEYWLDIAENNPAIIRQLENIMTPIVDFDGHTHDDIVFNQSLQYQIMSGNIPLTEDGLTLKTSLSFMDSFNLIYDPISTAKSKLFAPLQHIIDYAAKKTGSEILQNVLNTYTYNDEAIANNYKDVSVYNSIPFVGDATASIVQNLQDVIKNTTDSLDLSKYGITDIDEKNFIYDSLPIVGTFLRKVLEQGPMYYERTNSLLNLIAPGLFGATKIYQEKQNNYQQRVYPKRENKKTNNWVNYPKTNYRKYRNYRSYRKNTGSRYYGRSYRRNYSNYSYKANRAYHKHHYNRWVYPNAIEVGFYDKHYTKGGSSRLKALMRPNNGLNLKYKILNTKIYYNSK